MEKNINEKTLKLLTSCSMAKQALQIESFKGEDISYSSIGVDIRVPGAKHNDWDDKKKDFFDITDNDNYTVTIWAMTHYLGGAVPYRVVYKFSKDDPESKQAIRDFVDCMVVTKDVMFVKQGGYIIESLDDIESEEYSEEWKPYSPSIALVDGTVIGMAFSGKEYVDLVGKANKKALKVDENLKAVFEGKCVK